MSSTTCMLMLPYTCASSGSFSCTQCTQSAAGPCHTSSSVLLHNAPDFPSTVNPSGLQGDWAGLHWLYSTGATALIAASLLAHHAFYRRGNLRGACENDQSCSLTGGLLSLQEEKCSSTGQLFIDCNNSEPAVYSLTPDNQLWILICLAQWCCLLRRV